MKITKEYTLEIKVIDKRSFYFQLMTMCKTYTPKNVIIFDEGRWFFLDGDDDKPLEKRVYDVIKEVIVGRYILFKFGFNQTLHINFLKK